MVESKGIKKIVNHTATQATTAVTIHTRISLEAFVLSILTILNIKIVQTYIDI